MSCIFCQIVTGESDASVVTTGELTMAFLDLFPFAPGHTLVVPREHAVGLSDLPDDDAAEIMQVGRRVAVAARHAGLADAVNLFLADGQIAGQTVFHTHLHVIPRRAGDGFPAGFGSAPQADRAGLDAIATRLAEALPAS